jgi:hypothetical protein
VEQRALLEDLKELELSAFLSLLQEMVVPLEVLPVVLLLFALVKTQPNILATPLIEEVQI